MLKKTGIVLLLLLSAQYGGRPQGAAPTIIPGLAFANLYTQDGKPCPPECVSDSMEIVTWYPSPYNEYEELRLYPVQRDDNYCNNDKIGLMYYDDGGTPSFGDDDKMKVCKGTLLGWKEVGGGFWQQSSGSDISNTNSGKVTINTTDSNKVSLEASGAVRLGNYATGAGPNCSNAILGALVYDTTEKRPYVCALNASNSPVWKPLDSDYDRDGITDAVDYNDNDFNDATATEADVAQGKTFYSGGVQPKNRKTGTLNAIKGVFVHMEVGADASRCGGNSSCKSYELYSSVGEVSVDAPYNPPIYFTARPFRCKSPSSERMIYSLCINCGNPYGSCCYLTHICE